ncbi:MAG: 50S ribosomal protein L23 [Parcubacteria group bacterium]|nr:50S ribosomal protein L23 [Parcubacteria group bacterium]
MPASADSGKTEKFSHIIIRPRITEKASAQSGGNSYTFEVSKSANKIQIKNAIQEVYGVEPIKVNVINAKPKAKMVRNIWGKTASYKKAIVFLKDGDSIEFV